MAWPIRTDDSHAEFACGQIVAEAVVAGTWGTVKEEGWDAVADAIFGEADCAVVFEGGCLVFEFGVEVLVECSKGVAFESKLYSCADGKPRSGRS